MTCRLPVGLLLLPLGCSISPVQRGGALYAEARYVEAAEVFERTEPRLPEASPRERASYGVYRGMTMLALGDERRAARWLRYAYSIERREPGSLSPEARAELDRGWAELRARHGAGHHHPGQHPPAGARPWPGAPQAPKGGASPR